MDTHHYINEETFVISDHHFGHKRVGEFEPIRCNMATNSGFKDLDEFAISMHNKTVSKDDNILFLGDFAFKAIEYYSNILNGNKIIILGNHDRKAPLYRQYGWKVFDGIHIDMGLKNAFIYNDEDVSLLSGLVKNVNGNNILFSHYPVFDKNTYDRSNDKIQSRVKLFEHIYQEFDCDTNIHGHVHSKETSHKSCINVSVEKLNFIPIKIKDLLLNRGL